ncbi:hypothetical protein PRUPE_4G223600 [Prunus persica]|uniref:Uncharacterized protein n=1 Tax=Prunus persica TaxID=3760 RepID=A0A251PQW0_PRUPE|nr:hypothetical protein PRUPE_4G223600 [Prunus persica]
MNVNCWLDLIVENRVSYVAQCSPYITIDFFLLLLLKKAPSLCSPSIGVQLPRPSPLFSVNYCRCRTC